MGLKISHITGCITIAESYGWKIISGKANTQLNTIKEEVRVANNIVNLKNEAMAQVIEDYVDSKEVTQASINRLKEAINL